MEIGVQAEKAGCKALVLVGGGMPKAYWYHCGEISPADLAPGTLVEVPLKSRKLAGVVVATGFPELDFATKAILGLSLQHACVPRDWLELLQWLSRYYFTPLPQVFQAALPKVAARSLFHPPKRRAKTQTPDSVPVPLAAEGEAPHPTPAQGRAIEAVAAALSPCAYRAFLLHGVTGSGKTLVYLHLAARALALGRRVLVLLPEIALTPQTVARFESFLGRPVPVLHSGLSDPERRDLWKRLLAGEVDLVIGARSAALAPLENLGLIIVDEEHDSSYKQADPSPRYHARDVALFRGRQADCPVVLGSATPSLESYQAARLGKYTLLRLTERATAVALPRIEVVDMKAQCALQGDAPLSIPLRDAMQAALDRGEQTVLFLNRRGYAPRRVCTGCGETRMCPRCSVALVFHRQPRVLQCHYCGSIFAPEAPCPHCSGVEFLDVGRGVEKIEEFLRGVFPRTGLERLDRDNVGRAGSLEAALARFRSGASRILLGTQMVAKGHDFPKVEVVGVLDADAGLGFADFRAEERAFQLITQVAGRAGRRSGAGRVFLQTFRPEGRILQCALNHDYEHFYQEEAEKRQELGYPPFRRLLLCELSGPSEAEAAAVFRPLADRLRALAPQAHADVLGPVPAALKKVRNAYRLHLLIKCDYPNQLEWLVGEALHALPPKLPKKIKLRLDRDPVSLL